MSAEQKYIVKFHENGIDQIGVLNFKQIIQWCERVSPDYTGELAWWLSNKVEFYFSIDKECWVDFLRQPSLFSVAS